MKTSEAIEMLRRMQEPEAWEPQITEEAFEALEMAIDAIKNLPSAKPENQVHLCDSCRHVFPECPCEKDDVVFGNGKGNDNICACNKYEPSVQPEQRWIPCSKKLPNYMEPVLTWDGVSYCVEKRIRYIRDEEGNPIEGDWWVSDEYNDIESDYYPGLRDGAAIAWMSLPELYKEEKKK